MLPESEKTDDPTKYRPISCLSTVYKTLTGIQTTRIQNHITSKNIINQEQKECYKDSYGEKEQLLINKMMVENSRKAQKIIMHDLDRPFQMIAFFTNTLRSHEDL